MLDFRPSASAHFLPRPRLLGLLPQHAGHVVLFEAPYGYGKSILASQWARSLEEQGTRIVWTVAHGRDPSQAIATAAGLPPATPWEALLFELWKVPTLLVFEDLEALNDHSKLTPLLDDPGGIVLLASRTPVRDDLLGRFALEGRLTHVKAADLAFTLDEAKQFFRDSSRAENIHRETYGWPLPLHFASLTGDLPDEGSILQGMIDSLEKDEWQEALLMAAVPYIPSAAASAATVRLGSSGFAQQIESGFLLNGLIAEQIRNRHPGEVLEAVRANAMRLPTWLVATGFERTGDHEALQQVLERVLEQPWRHAPEQFLQWDELLGPPANASARRNVSVGSALKSLGRHEEATTRLAAALESEDLSPEERIFALGEAGWSLVFSDKAAAQKMVLQGEALLEQVPPDRAGRFLANASVVDSLSGRFEEALDRLYRARDILPVDSEFRIGVEINIAINVWDRSGDLDLRLRVQRDTLDDVLRLYPNDAYGQARDVAMMHWWLGDTDGARKYFEIARGGRQANPGVSLEAEAGLACLAWDPTPMSRLLRASVAWNMPYVHDVITMYAIRLAPAEKAQALYSKVESPGFAAVGLAEKLAASDKHQEAIEVIDAALKVHTDREYLLYLKSCRYRCSRDERDLAAFLELTLAGERLLPGFVPLEELPKDRPELARHYPLKAVLHSGWTEAAAARRADIPPLQVRLMGRLKVSHMGEELRLLKRPAELLVLLCLGLSRDQVATALWPELEPAARANNLHVQMNALRQTLDPGPVGSIMKGDGSLHARTDLARLRAALATGDAPTALEIYQARLAPEISLPVVEIARESLHAEVVALFLAQTHDSAYAARIVELDPLNEEAVRMTIRILLANGHRWAAVQRFETFRDALGEAVGLEPEPETSYLLKTL